METVQLEVLYRVVMDTLVNTGYDCFELDGKRSGAAEHMATQAHAFAAQLGMRCRKLADAAGRDRVGLEDVLLAMRLMGMSCELI